MRSLDNGSIRTFPFVTTYAVDSTSRFLAFVVADTSGTGNGVFSLDLSNPTSNPIPVYADSSVWADYLNWNNRRGNLAFLAGKPGKKNKRSDAELFLWTPGEDEAKSALADKDLSGDWKVYHTNKL